MTPFIEDVYNNFQFKEQWRINSANKIIEKEKDYKILLNFYEDTKNKF